MATPVTEISYPPLDSQATTSFIDNQVQAADQTGDLQTDFAQALYNVLGLQDGRSKYSLDDLWKRYIINVIAGDGNAESGNPAAAGGKGNNAAAKGQHVATYYSQAFLRNPGNANKFPLGAPEVLDPSAYTLEDMWNLDGSNSPTGQVTNLAGYFTSGGINGMCWSDDGTLLTIANGGDDKVKTLTCSTPWDPSSVPASDAVVGNVGITNPYNVGFSDDGATWWCLDGTDTLRVFKDQCSTPYVVGGTATSTEAKNGSAFSLGGSADGPAWISRDGLQAFWFRADSSPVIDNFMRHCTMTTPWDLDTLQAYDSEVTDGQLGVGGPSINGMMIVSDDGTKMILGAAAGGSCRLIEMATANDVSLANLTLNTVDTTSFDNFSGTKDGDLGVMDRNGKIWRCDANNTNWDIGVWAPT